MRGARGREVQGRVGCLIPKLCGPQRGSRAPRGPAAPFPHLAACLLGAHVFRLVPGSPQVCEPENLDENARRCAQKHR